MHDSNIPSTCNPSCFYSPYHKLVFFRIYFCLAFIKFLLINYLLFYNFNSQYTSHELLIWFFQILHAIFHLQLELLYIVFLHVYGPRSSFQTIVFQELSNQISSLHTISKVAFHDCQLISKLFNNQILLHLLLQNKLTTPGFGFTILIYNIYYLLSESNFKLHFTTWVFPINKHQASNLVTSLQCYLALQLLLPDYFQPMHWHYARQ
jgi:hypothetical protein